ncbi:ATP-binding protein [Pseudemcibacter aquimaris]|uniref:ATP-binding protein n=1 Tax=Pseudemcibacter aquimaris TaxID=2857064 RepID=UPI0020130835|nr:ATP-binding protein [Pseudemcibacter aquimaris]MCC3861545.1 GHKL domain-containing protein [Pseudemcibacter aquimaris]WDU58314.1 GHKL domain-containing protein [Pseudemcibacter aquimaris]
MSSLKTRLNLGVFLVSLIFFSTLMIINIVFFNSFGKTFVESRLQYDTDGLIANLAPDESGLLRLNEVSLNPVFSNPFSGNYYRIDLDHQTYLSRSLWDQTLAEADLEVGQVRLIESDGPVEQKLLVLQGAYEKEGQKIIISVAEDYTPITENLQSLTIALVFLNGGIVVLLMLIQRFIVNRGMEPLQKTSEELTAIGSGDKYFLDEKVPEEVLPLVREINKLMVMVDNRIKRSSTALGNLAHALKTPLALIEQSASGSKDERSSEEIISATAQIKHQLDSELKRARIIGTSAHGHKINIKTMLVPLIDTLEKIYQDKSLEISADINDNATYVGDQHDMMELFGNLLDNACKWAKSKIAVTVEGRHNFKVIIEDDGPGITDEKIKEIEKRGIRLDEAGEGHGLGLSIVREIIDLIGADIKYGRSEQLGGLKITIQLGSS